MMFVVASHVVETLTGKWLGDFLRERIWEPLGMNGTVSFVSRSSRYVLSIVIKWLTWERERGRQSKGERCIHRRVVSRKCGCMSSHRLYYALLCFLVLFETEMYLSI